MKIRLALVLAALAFSLRLTAAPLELPLWPEGSLPKIPEKEELVNHSTDPAKPRYSTHFVSTPTLTIHLPANATAPVPAIIICPGGGYSGLALDREGNYVAEWLNSIGVAGITLKYRMPRPEISGTETTPWPLQDAWRALRMVRAHAEEWKIDPARVGIMGFSAGGHLASTAATHFDPAKPDDPDPLNHFGTRPDFAVLLYPVVTFKDPFAHKGSREKLLGKTPDEKLVELYSNETQVTPQTPPTFLAHARDDHGVPLANSEQFHEALKKAGVETELHVFEQGGHGFGLGTAKNGTDQWPKLLEAWLRKTHVLPAQ